MQVPCTLPRDSPWWLLVLLIIMGNSRQVVLLWRGVRLWQRRQEQRRKNGDTPNL